MPLPGSLDDVIGSMLESWLTRDTDDDQCRWCNSDLEEPSPAPDRFCDDDCQENWDVVQDARLRLGRRDLNERGYD